MVSLAWHLVTFALPQRCIWRVGGRRTGGKKGKRERRREKPRVKEFNCRLSILFEPISRLIWGQGGRGVMFNEVATCHLFPNSSFTQVAPFNGALMEPKFNCTACGLPNRIPFPSLKDGVIEWHLIFTTFCLGWVSLPMPLSLKLNWSVMQTVPQSCHCRLWTFRGFFTER